MTTPDDAPAKAETRWRRLARRLASLAIALELAGLAGFFAMLLAGERSRATLIALYLPRQPLLVAAIAGALLAPLTNRRRVLLALQLALCLVILFPVMGLSLSTSKTPEPTASGATPRVIHLATYNVHFGKEGRAALLDEISRMNPDILVVQAAYDTLGQRLRERFPGYTVHQDHELAMATRFPLRQAEIPPLLPNGTLPMYAKYVIDTPDGALRVYSVHPYSPRHALFGDDDSTANIAARDAQVSAVVTAARTDVPPFVIVGDTNLPPMSSISRRSFDRFTDAWDEAGFGFGYTFPAKRPWMRIDRALGSDGVRFLSAHVGPRGASDHRPLFVDLALDTTR